MHGSNYDAPFSAKINQLVDERFGVLKVLGLRQTIPGSPSFFHSYSQAGNTKLFTKWENSSYGGGASLNREYALAKAVGEAVERYCSAIYSKEALPFCTFNEADFPCVDPHTFAFYSECQCAADNFMFSTFKHDTNVRWVTAYDCKSGEDKCVPASTVFVPYYFDRAAGETPINQPISTGQSCHGDYFRSCIGSLCEVIERDAFTLTWQAALSHKQIDQESLPQDLKLIVSNFFPANGKLYLFDITTDNHVPTIMSVMVDQSENGPPLVVATATDPSPVMATRKSLEELAHTRHYMNLIFRHLERFPSDHSRDEILTEIDHMNFWCDRDNIEKSQFLFRNPKTISFDQIRSLEQDSIEDTLESLVGCVHSTGHDVLFVDLTTRDIQQVGLAVVRAIVPGYQSLVMGYKYRILGGERLWNVPQRMGFAPVNRTKGDNPIPHPFP